MFEELTIILRLTVLNIRFFLLIKGFLTAKTFKIYYEISKDSYPQKARKVYELVMMHENMNGEMSRNYLFKCKNPHGPSLHRGLRRGGVGIEPTKTTSTTYKDIRTDRLNLFFLRVETPSTVQSSRQSISTVAIQTKIQPVRYSHDIHRI